MKNKILVTDPIAKEGLAILENYKDFDVTILEKVPSKKELIKLIPKYEALVIRSGTNVSKEVIESASKLKIIARAGVGIDNIDIKSATAKGILIVNAPSGNTISTAEQTWALILSLARKISWAHKSILNGEWNRKAFSGIQLHGKNIGVIGLGRIGTEVITKAKAFGMNILGYDPYLSRDQAKLIGVELCSLEEIYKKADLITLHTPLNANTKNMIAKTELKIMKKNALLINCARGGLIEEDDLKEALEKKQILGAAFDAFLKEPPDKSNPLIKLPNFLCTPHLGAATKEAQISVAIETSEAIIDFFSKGVTRNAVNFPSISPDIYAENKSLVTLCEKMGYLIGSVRKGHMKNFNITFPSCFKEKPLHIFKLAILKGFLEPILAEQVNFINALNIAKERGISITETFRPPSSPAFDKLICIEVITEEGKFSVYGTLFIDEEIRITQVNGYGFDIEPYGEWLIIKNKDIPGVVGILGTILGKNNVNIATMQLGRKEKGDKAMTFIRIDESISSKIINEIKEHDVIIDTQAISF